MREDNFLELFHGHLVFDGYAAALDYLGAGVAEHVNAQHLMVLFADDNLADAFAVLVFGNEATGLPDRFATFCTPVIIRHSHDIDSLNLPMAAGIAMYELTKKNWR